MSYDDSFAFEPIADSAEILAFSDIPLVITPPAQEQIELLVNEQNTKPPRKQGFYNFLRFSALRYSANVEWLAGTIAGNTIRETTGASGWLIGGLVGGAVTLLEYPQTTYGAKKFDTDAISAESYSIKSEALATASALWQGAGATTKVNASFGLPNSRKRRWFQSGAYGAAVGAWSTPLPGFRHAAGAAQKGVEYAWDNLAQTSATVFLGSAAIYGALEGVKRFRSRRGNPTV